MGWRSRSRASRGFSGYWAPYVSVAERRNNAAREIAALAKQGKKVKPVELAGRTIAETFWGKAWCDNLEAYSDYSNRLPRGRTYVRNGSVVHLDVKEGVVEALVQGSEMYTVSVGIAAVEPARWKAIRAACAGRIGSIVELLRGKMSADVMQTVARPDSGLFPAPKHITMKCSCPDWATMCKHVAAVLYGVGARLDVEPELLFLLRRVDAAELVAEAASARGLPKGKAKPARALDGDLSSVFGIELEAAAPIAKRAGKAKSQKAPMPSRVHAAKSRSPELTGDSTPRTVSVADLGRLGLTDADVSSLVVSALLEATNTNGVYVPSPRLLELMREHDIASPRAVAGPVAKPAARVTKAPRAASRKVGKKDR